MFFEPHMRNNRGPLVTKGFNFLNTFIYLTGIIKFECCRR